MRTVCVFVHVPKAGGSTLQEILQRQYAPAATLDIEGENMVAVQSSVDRLRRMPAREREGIRCLKGHVPFGVHRWLGGEARYITMLRDPVERAVSDYFFALNTPGHRLFERLHRERLSLKDFVLVREEQGLANLYCRMLSEPLNWDSLADSAHFLPEGALSSARENLRRHFAVVGITERFDESLLLMQDAFGWKDVRYERSNVTPDKPAQSRPSGEVLEAIRRCNRCDIELYEFATRLLAERIAEAGAGFQSRARRFPRENERYRRWRRLRRAVASRLPSTMARILRRSG